MYGKTILGILGVCLLLWSCASLNQHIMLRVPKGFQFDSAPAIPDSIYRISPNDVLHLRILASRGADALSSDESNIDREFQVPVEFDGKVKVPVLGRVPVGGLTRRAIEDSLESWYSVYYTEPFVKVNVDNRQVIVFPGTGSNAKVVKFEREDMNVFEALARVGGITLEGKAHRIKLIRGDLKNPIVIKIDLSTIEGMKSADLTLQSGDIIYVDTRENFGKTFMTHFQPYVIIVSSALTVVTAVVLFSSLGK